MTNSHPLSDKAKALGWFKRNRPPYQEGCGCADCTYAKPIIETIEAALSRPIAPLPVQKRPVTTYFKCNCGRSHKVLVETHIYEESRSDGVKGEALAIVQKAIEIDEKSHRTPDLSIDELYKILAALKGEKT